MISVPQRCAVERRKGEGLSLGFTALKQNRARVSLPGVIRRFSAGDRSKCPEGRLRARSVAVGLEKHADPDVKQYVQ